MAKTQKTRKRKHRLLKNIFNPRGWMSYDTVKKSGEDVSGMFRDIAGTKKPIRNETFEQALKRMNMTEEDVATRMVWLYRGSWIYFAFSSLIALYALYSLFVANLMTFAVTMIIAVLGYTLAFRDSFFYFQMKRRRLGCTFKEWVAFILRKDISKSTDLK